MHLKFNKMLTFQDSNSKIANDVNDFNSNLAKIADLQVCFGLVDRLFVVSNIHCGPSGVSVEL